MSWNFVRFQKNINPAFAENFKKIGQKSKKAQLNKLIGLFVYFPFEFFWMNLYFFDSWDQIGEFDLPAMIDKVIDTTGAEKIHYGGHSMGTTSFMVMANKKPEYQEKIILANFLAPIAFVDHMTSPLKYIAPFAGSIDVSFSRKVRTF